MAKMKCPKCAYLNESSAGRCRRCGAALPSVSFEAGAAAEPPPAQTGDTTRLRRGQVLNNRYTVLDLIGRGGMGCIYKVHDNVLGEDLALKMLLPQFVQDKTVGDRFLNEARITRKLAHPNIVRVHDIGMTNQGMYISMEYVEGDSLRALLEKQPPGTRLPVRQVLHIIEQLCVALDYAHQHTIHRDIKPENVMLTQDNHIKLMDFGISKLKDNRFATAASMVMGTPYYMSPEQLRNSRDVDARADIYSLGVVLYELLTGNMPTGVPRPASQILKDIPPALDGIVAKCVDPDREKRFGSAGALRTALLPIIEVLDEGKDPAKTLGRRRLTKDGQPGVGRVLMAAALAVVALAAAGFGLWLVEQWDRPAGSVTPQAVSLHGEHAQGSAPLELDALIQRARAAAETLVEPERRQREWMEAGAARYAEAIAAAQSGGAEAFNSAQDALQYYLAALMAPKDMTFIPPGTVTIEGQSVFVPGFFMDRAEVTLGQFASFARQVTGGWPLPAAVRDSVDAYPEYPASFVAWFDAQAYAAWAGKALPTRAQWARAAYGNKGASDIYPWGAEWKEGAANLHGAHTQPVRSFKDDVSWSGCHDLAGNVMEWTRTPARELDDGAVPDFGDAMLVCGGSFLMTQPLRAAMARDFETRAPDLGFRCVLEVPTDPAEVWALLGR